MARIIQFNSDDEYISAQKYSLKKRGIGPYFTDVEINKCADWWNRNRSHSPTRAICHGARNGLECDEFQKHYQQAEIVGTDLFPYSGRSIDYAGKCTVEEWNFSMPRQEWLGVCDFIYSNSLDHARDPLQTLSVWKEQLRPDGAMFIQWTINHTSAHRGDCFGADLYEYVVLMNRIGTVQDLLYSKSALNSANILRRRALESVVIVASVRHV